MQHAMKGKAAACAGGSGVRSRLGTQHMLAGLSGCWFAGISSRLNYAGSWSQGSNRVKGSNRVRPCSLFGAVVD